MKNETTLSNTVASFLFQKEELEAQIGIFKEEIKCLKPKYEHYSNICLFGRSKAEKIEIQEAKLFKYFRKPTLTLREVANYIGIEYEHLSELIKTHCIAFDYVYFPSSPNGDYIFVTLEALATFIVEHTEDNGVNR